MNRIERRIEQFFLAVFWRRLLGNTQPGSFTPPPPPPPVQTLDHITLGISSSSVVEVDAAPTLTLAAYQTSDTSTPYTDTLLPAAAYSGNNGAVATINPTTGAITLQGPGSVTFTVTAGGKSATASLTVTAETLTSTPSSLTGTEGGTSTALVIKNQETTDVTSGCTFVSSDPDIATVSSSGVVTYVAVGTATIHVEHTATGETVDVGVTVSAASGATVTSIKLSLNGGVGTQALLFTGQSTTFTAADQDDNPLDSSVGTWSSNNTSKCPINSSGVASPANGVGKAELKYTHTASGIEATVACSILGNGSTAPTFAAEVKGDDYANDTAFKGDIASAIGGTNTGTPAPKFGDGIGASLIAWDDTASRRINGRPTFRQTYDNPTGVASSGQLYTPISSCSRAWVIQTRRCDTGFSTAQSGAVGADGVSHDPGGWKYGPNVSDASGARLSIDIDQASGAGEDGSAAFNLYNNVAAGGAQQTVIQNFTPHMFADALVYCTVGLAENFGNRCMAARAWYFKIGDDPLTESIVPAAPIQGPVSDAGANRVNTSFQFTGRNYNLSTPLGAVYSNIGESYCINGDTYGDPLGLLQDTSTPTLTSVVSAGAPVAGTNNVSFKLAGTDFTNNCRVDFSNTNIHVNAISFDSDTQISVNANILAAYDGTVGTATVTNNASKNSSSAVALTDLGINVPTFPLSVALRVIGGYGMGTPSDGDALPTITDQQNGIVFSIPSGATTAARPTYKASGLNSLPTIVFNGSQGLDAALDPAIKIANWYEVIVFKATTRDIERYLTSVGSQAAGVMSGHRFSLDSTHAKLVYGDGSGNNDNSSATDGFTLATWHWMMLEHWDSGYGNYTLDGTSKTLIDPKTTTYPSTGGLISLGHLFGDALATGFKGEVAEWVIGTSVDAAHSGSHITSVQTYLRGRYGTSFVGSS